MPVFKMRQEAASGQRFAPDAFDSAIGRTVPIMVSDGGLGTGVPSGEATLVAAVVADDGLSVELTIDMPSPTG